MPSAVSPVIAIVAVVEDDSRVLESFEALLESAGFSARLFKSATEFLESGAVAEIHCLISDIRMPVIDGWRLEEIVTEMRPDLPVILVTGDDDAHRATRPRRIRGHHALFKKPFDSHDLLAVIARALSAQAD